MNGPLDLGLLAFGAPLALLGIAALPVVLWLLRLTPPSPRRQSFPALQFLIGLHERSQQTARTPPWLLILRLVAVMVALLGLAHPTVRPPNATLVRDPLLIVIDNGWTAAAGWEHRRQAILRELTDAATEQRPVAIVTTAPDEGGTQPTFQGLGPATDAQRQVQALTPKPWSGNPLTTAERITQAVDAGRIPAPVDILWFSDAITPLLPGTEQSTAASMIRPSGREAMTRLAATLQRLGPLTIVRPTDLTSDAEAPSPLDQPALLLPPQRETDGLKVTLLVSTPADEPLAEGTSLWSVRATDAQGRTLATAAFRPPQTSVPPQTEDPAVPPPPPSATPASAPNGSSDASPLHTHRLQATIPLPPDALQSVARVELSAPDGRPPGAAGVQILGDRWRSHPVGLVIAKAKEGPGIPLLSSATYIRRALAPSHDVRTGSLGSLLSQPVRTLILPDMPAGTSLSAEQHQHLLHWVTSGGLLIRFAGPHLAADPTTRHGTDPLLPVGLRQGGRTLGGVLSWSAPTTLAPFPEDSPFYGLTIPPDIHVTSQVLTDPGSGADAQVWARLSDGTSLVSAARRDQGWVVLIHTTADPSWTDLPLSGLFPAMLERLSALAMGAQGPATSLAISDGPLLPASVLDGLGHMSPPSATVRPLPQTDPTGSPDARTDPDISPTHPPGLYGPKGSQQALNVGRDDSVLTPFTEWPSGTRFAGQQTLHGPYDLRPWLLTAALILLLIDTLISLRLRGLLGPRPGGSFARRRSASSSSATTLLVLVTMGTLIGSGLGREALIPTARAAAGNTTPDGASLDEATIDEVLDARLAYVSTHDTATDQLVVAGLRALTQVLRDRTAVELATPVKVDPERDPLVFYPLLYWPVTTQPPVVDQTLRQRLDQFRAHGGIIVFDVPNASSPAAATEALRQTLQALGSPSLIPMPADHLLTRTFYLTRGLPGRGRGSLWIEPDSTENQGVSSIIAGTGDWAGAWASDARGRPMLPMLNGGNRGREMALRAGVNMVVYALTGTYKSDQVHVPAILERLSQ